MGNNTRENVAADNYWFNAMLWLHIFLLTYFGALTLIKYQVKT
jgi:hypothetical protein